MLAISPFDLFRSMLLDLAEMNDVSLNRDLDTAVKRFEHEGLPFLTKTLPTFAQAFEKGLAVGAIQHPSAFKRKGALPAFLHGLTSRVFCAKTGTLLPDPCYVAVYSVRQVCYLFYKYEVPYTDKQLDAAITQMVCTDHSLSGEVEISPDDQVFLVAESLLTDIFKDADFRAIRPKLGPGSTNVGPMSQQGKTVSVFGQSTGYYDVDHHLPSPGVFSLDESDGVLASASSTDRSDGGIDPRRVSRVSGVPKNSKGPRIISAEHPLFMWAQLGLGNYMAEWLESHPITRGHVNFTDQSVNSRLALQASSTGQMATLDMKEASDRVSLTLCRQLMPARLMRIIEEIRSTHTCLPSGVLIPLEKVAPMGNGFCFPLESIVFWALAVGVLAVRMRPGYVTEEMIKRACQQVYTYGDDLIVPAVHAPEIMRGLERYGLRFNRDKSFWTGPFRESCGTDAFDGVNVTPLKIKKLIPRRPSDVSSIVGYLQSAKDWGPMLPRLTALMRRVAYNAIGHKPHRPYGWEGCLGEDTSYEDLVGRHVSMGDIIRRGKPYKHLPNKNGVWLKTPHELAPSDGKLVKVLTVKELDEDPEEAFSDVHKYLLRAVAKAPNTSSSWKTLFEGSSGDIVFTRRYTSRLEYRKVLVT